MWPTWHVLQGLNLQESITNVIKDHSTKKPVTTMLTSPGHVQFYIVTTWEAPGKHLETTGADDPTL